MVDQDNTKVKKVLNWIENHPLLSVIIIVGVVIISISTFLDSARNLGEEVKRVFSGSKVEGACAVYAYERAFFFEGSYKTYYYEMRNLASNCSLWRTQIKNLPIGRSITPTPGSWIILKLYIENSTESTLSNLRIGLRGLPIHFEEVNCTPNIEASLKHETTANKSIGVHVIVIPSFAPDDKAVLSLSAPLKKEKYQSLLGRNLDIEFPFISSDQIKISRPKIKKLNAMELVKRESQLFTGKRTFGHEKIEYRILSPNEPDVVENDDFETLPVAKKCPEGTGGNW